MHALSLVPYSRHSTPWRTDRIDTDGTQVVQPACLILERLAGETFPLVQYDFVDLVYTLLEMAASRFVRPHVSVRVSRFVSVCSIECGVDRPARGTASTRKRVLSLFLRPYPLVRGYLRGIVSKKAHRKSMEALTGRGVGGFRVRVRVTVTVTEPPTL